MRPIRLLLILLLLLVRDLSAQVMPQPLPIDSIPCLHTYAGQDTLRFPGSHRRFAAFYRRLDTLFLTGRGKINVLHIGGSHVQAGYFSHRVRTNFAYMGQPNVGSRGILFPFKALNTNAPFGYQLDCTGRWSGQRCLLRELDTPLGLSGASATTRDTLATLRLALCDIAQWPMTSLRLLGHAEGPSVRPVLVCRGDTIEAISVDACRGYLFPLVSDQYPAIPDSCIIAFRGIVQDSVGFVVRGLLPEGHTSGITYVEAGVNGAAVPSWLRCELLEQDLTLLPPDLVIFGIGINDANVLPQTFDAEQFKANYRELMCRIRRVNPSCCFLFITNNDCWFNVKGRRRQFNTNTPKVQQAMTELAREFDGAVFDVFAMMGGLGSSAQWVAEGLQRPDHIHFTREGYELWGDLLYNALVNDYLNAE